MVEPIREVHTDGLGVVTMTITLENVVVKYLAAKKLSAGTCKEYRSTATKWLAWGKGVDIDQIEVTVHAQGRSEEVGCPSNFAWSAAVR